MEPRSYKILFITGVASLIGQGAVRASPITLQFSGEVTSVFSDFPSPSPVFPTIEGAEIDLLLNFDPLTLDSIPDPSVGSYTMSGPTLGIIVSFNPGTTFDTFVPAGTASESTVNIGVANDIGQGVDQYTILSTMEAPNSILTIEMTFEDPAGIALDSDAIFTGASEVSELLPGIFFLEYEYTLPDGRIYQTQIQGIFNFVPEPSALLLGLSGLWCGVVALYARRRLGK